MHTEKKPGKCFMGNDGNFVVNFHSTCFMMTRLGHYVPWAPTVHHGALMPTQEWVRVRDLIGADKVKELSVFLNKKAATIAESLKENRFYKMTDEQRFAAQENYNNYLAAKAEGITVEDYLRRKAIREERQAKRLQKNAQQPKVSPKPPEVRKMNSGKFNVTNNFGALAQLLKTA